MRLLHTADLHFQSNPDILDEVQRVAGYIVALAEVERPDAVVLAGDTMDEWAGKIRLDSDAARAAIAFVTALANVAPVVIVRGTKSHDREAPYIFACLHTRHPVVVAFEPLMLFLVEDVATGKKSFSAGPVSAGQRPVAAFTLVPQLDKCWLDAASIRDGNREFRELFHDLMAGYGMVNDSLDVPRVLVGHGMVTGATFSSGQQAVGDDLEMPLDALLAAGCDVVCLGHVHKHQIFHGNIVYSGSPARLNFGEPEEKGVCLIEID